MDETSQPSERICSLIWGRMWEIRTSLFVRSEFDDTKANWNVGFFAGDRCAMVSVATFSLTESQSRSM